MIQLEKEEDSDRDHTPERDDLKVCLKVIARNAAEVHIEADPERGEIREQYDEHISYQYHDRMGDPLHIYLFFVFYRFFFSHIFSPANRVLMKLLCSYV